MTFIFDDLAVYNRSVDAEANNKHGWPSEVLAIRGNEFVHLRGLNTANPTAVAGPIGGHALRSLCSSNIDSSDVLWWAAEVGELRNGDGARPDAPGGQRVVIQKDNPFTRIGLDHVLHGRRDQAENEDLRRIDALCIRYRELIAIAKSDLVESELRRQAGERAEKLREQARNLLKYFGPSPDTLAAGDATTQPVTATAPQADAVKRAKLRIALESLELTQK
jgi:hypothetical protein